jgi:hypothetical protein
MATKLIFSLVASLLIMYLLAISSILFGLHFGYVWLLLIFVELILFTIIYKLKRWPLSERMWISFSMVDFLPLLSFVFLFIITMLFQIYPFLFVRGDSWRYLQRSMSVSRDILRNPGSVWIISQIMNYPQVMTFVLGAEIFMSSLPAVNLLVLLGSLLNALLPFAYYSLGESMFKDKLKASLTAVASALVAGAGWVLYVYFYYTNLSHFNLSALIDLCGNMALYDFFYPLSKSGEAAPALYVQAMLALLALLSIMWLLNEPKGNTLFATGLLFVTAYLLHVEEAFYFIIIIFPAYMYIRKDGSICLKYGLSFIIGLLLVEALDLIMPIHFYDKYASPVILAGVLALLLFFHSLANRTMFYKSLSNFFLKIQNYLGYVTIITYLTLLLIYIILIPSYQDVANKYWLFGSFPIYYLPVHLGFGIIPLIVATFMLNKLESREKSVLQFALLVLFLLSAILFTCMLLDLKQPVPSPQRMVQRLAGIPVFISFPIFISLLRILYIKAMKLFKLILISLCVLLFVFSSISVILVVNVWSVKTGPWGEPFVITSSELESLNYLVSNGNVNLRAAAQTELSSQLIQISGIQAISNEYFHYYYPALSLKSLSSLFVVSSDLGYIAEYGLRDRNKNSILDNEIAKVLPVFYNNNNIVIYYLPPLTSPSYLSSIGAFVRYPINDIGVATLISTSYVGIPLAILDPESVSWGNIKYLLIPQEVGETSTIWDGTTNDFWQPINYGSGNLGKPSISQVVKDGVHGLSINVPVNGTFGDWAICHFYTSKVDWSNYSYIQFPFYGMNTGARIALLICSSDNDVMGYVWDDNWSGWKDILINLLSPTFSWGTPTLKDVKFFKIQTPFNENQAGNWYIGSMILSTSPLVLKQDTIEKIKKWVAEGGALVFVHESNLNLFNESINNTSRHTILVNAIEINNTIFPIDPPINVNHTYITLCSKWIPTISYISGNSKIPIVFSMKVGKGEVRFVNIRDLLILLRNNIFDKESLLKYAGLVLGYSLGLKAEMLYSNFGARSHYWETYFDIKSSTQITLSGNVTVLSNGLVLSSETPLYVRNLVVKDGQTTISFAECYVEVVDSRYINVNAFTQRVNVLSGRDFFGELILSGGRTVFHLYGDALIRIISNREMITFNATKIDISFDNINGTLLKLASPTFLVNGSIYFGNAELDQPNNARSGPILLNGFHIFSLDVFDEDRVLGHFISYPFDP